MNPETSSAFVSGSAGTARIGFVTVPAFCWVSRSQQIRDFILLYRDLAATERNTWAVAHLDSLIENVSRLERRAGLAWNSEQVALSNYTGEMQFPGEGGRPLP